MKKIKWGIIATGGIANKFALHFKRIKNAKLIAVGSRFKKKAKDFANKYKMPRYYGSYQELVNDPEIDIVYIATPHNLHKSNTIMALKAGKAVLCEKPFSINHKEASEMITIARKKKLFLMEAMWSRFNPGLVKLKEIIDKKLIGNILQISGDFSFQIKYEPKKRWFNPELGGGALLDIGVYPISFTQWLLGEPSNIKSSVIKAKNGVDAQNNIVLEYNNKVITNMISSFKFEGSREMFIGGTKGEILIHKHWYRPLKISLSIRGKKNKVINIKEPGFGLNFQVDHVNNCLRNGKLESEIMPLKDSLSVMSIMDKIRAQWKFKYPMEK